MRTYTVIFVIALLFGLYSSKLSSSLQKPKTPKQKKEEEKAAKQAEARKVCQTKCKTDADACRGKCPNNNKKRECEKGCAQPERTCNNSC